MFFSCFFESYELRINLLQRWLLSLPAFKQSFWLNMKMFRHFCMFWSVRNSKELRHGSWMQDSCYFWTMYFDLLTCILRVPVSIPRINFQNVNMVLYWFSQKYSIHFCSYKFFIFFSYSGYLFSEESFSSFFRMTIKIYILWK